MVLAAILDGPYPDTRREGDAVVPPSRAVGMRGSIKARGGDAWCHQGSYRGRGCPESPHRAWWSSRRLWRCRPARPPTHRNTALRAAPRCADSHPSAAPRRVDPHPDLHPRTETPPCAPPRDASIPTPMRHIHHPPRMLARRCISGSPAPSLALGVCLGWSLLCAALQLHHLDVQIAARLAELLGHLLHAGLRGLRGGGIAQLV
jgi:hypothetical protein